MSTATDTSSSSSQRPPRAPRRSTKRCVDATKYTGTWWIIDTGDTGDTDDTGDMDDTDARARGRAYVLRPFATKAAAEAACRDLLTPYPAEHEWRTRLRVEEREDLSTEHAPALDQHADDIEHAREAARDAIRDCLPGLDADELAAIDRQIAAMPQIDACIGMEASP